MMVYVRKLGLREPIQEFLVMDDQKIKRVRPESIFFLHESKEIASQMDLPTHGMVWRKVRKNI